MFGASGCCSLKRLDDLIEIGIKFVDKVHKAGVKMKNLYVEWNADGECFMRHYADFVTKMN